MDPVVVLPDTEAAVLAYLRMAVATRSEPVLAGLKLGTFTNPTVLPFAAVRRVGGTSPAPGWDTARVAVQVWAVDAGARMDIAQILRALTAAAHDRVDTWAVTFSTEVLGPSALPDPVDSTKEIVQFTHELHVRTVTP